MNADFIHCVDQFISDVCAGKNNETPNAYRSKLARLERWLCAAHLSLDQLEACHIEAFRRSMFEQKEIKRGSHIVPGHLSPFTIHTVLRTVKHFLRWSHEHTVTHCDLSHFKIQAPPLPDPKAVDPENALALMYAAARMGEMWERVRNLAMLYTLRDTGGRIGAILKADMDNLDLAQGKLYVVEKGEKPLTLYINEPTALALHDWLSVRPSLDPKDRKLFLSYRGRGFTRSGFYSLLNRLIDEAGLRGCGRVNPHAFRHAWARDALTSGEDLTRVSQTLGHTTVRVTSDYYARWTDGELKKAHAQYSPGAKLPIIKPR